MARKRTIAPGFFHNEDLGECSPLARLLFAGLWCWADREGRVEDRPKRLRAEILPYDSADGDQLVSELIERGFVERYEVDGVKVLQIVNFRTYQDPHPRETPSELPVNPKANLRQTKGEPEDDQGTAKVPPRSPKPSKPSSPSRPSQPSQPASPPTPQPSADAGLAGDESEGEGGDMLLLRSTLAEHLGLPQALEVGGDRGSVLAFFRQQIDAVGEDVVIADCLAVAAKSTTGTPSSLAWFVGWLGRLPLRSVQ
jgi:hypothetical protein